MRDRWIELRNRLLGDARFRRFALRFPLTRGIARRRAAGVFDLVTGFVHSQILAAGIELGIFERLRAGPLSIEDIAPALPRASNERWLKAAAALELVERLSDGRWTLGSQGAALAAEPGIAAMVRHHRLLYADLADPVQLLARGRGGLSTFWPYADAEPEGVANYSALMAASQPMVAEQVLDAWRGWRSARRLLDIGGGEGAFALAAVRRLPQLRATVFDLPAVAIRAEAAIVAADMTERLTACGGSFHGALPTGHDVISLVRIVHDHDDAPAQALLNAARIALPPGGSLVLAEPMAGTRDAERMGDAYFGLYLLAMGSGRPRTLTELTGMLRNAGFERIHEQRSLNPLICRVLVARS